MKKLDEQTENSLEGLEVLTIAVPGRPKGKGRPRFRTAKGRPFVQTFTPGSTKEKENQIREEFIERYGMDKADYKGPVEIAVTAIYAIPKNTPQKRLAEELGTKPIKKPDIDNVIKLVLDALNGVAYKDDKQVVSITAEKMQREVPETVISVFYGTERMEK